MGHLCGWLAGALAADEQRLGLLAAPRQHHRLACAGADLCSRQLVLPSVHAHPCVWHSYVDPPDT